MKINLKARAKINLGLDVTRRREDGYHEVRMIMQTVNLYDRISIEDTEEPGIQIKTNLHYVPTDESNLCHRAAKLLMDEFEIGRGLRIDLKKTIPVAAGLAGGSSDAAAVMVGVNRIFSLGLDKTGLMERSVRIGADVPYCIMRGTALAEGIGEILTPLDPMPDCFVVLVKPVVGISTKLVYENLRLDEVGEHPDIDGMAAAIRAKDLTGITSRLGNVLESVAIKEYPVVGEIKNRLTEYGALGSLMSGSGSTVFGIFDDKERAETAADRLKGDSGIKQVFVRKPFSCCGGGIGGVSDT
jgi:4-diphosphocytidyl-2-C-methyl-D-erythritol kinase